jgi:hypothetical protein
VTTALFSGSSEPVIERPRGWTVIYPADVGSEVSPGAFLTNNSRATFCRPSIASCVPFRRGIAPGQVLVSWFEGGGGGVSVPDRSSWPLRIDGVPAMINVVRRPPFVGLCPKGTTGEVTAGLVDAFGSPGSTWSVTACIRGPHLARLRRQVVAMVRSYH